MKEEKKKVVAIPATKAIEKEPEKAVEKVEPIKTVTKEETMKSAEKKPAKKVSAKKTPVKKNEINEKFHLEFAGKSYLREDLIKSVKDIWKYDYKKKAADLCSIDLYVKPEEGRAYYVINGEVHGDFIV